MSNYASYAPSTASVRRRRVDFKLCLRMSGSGIGNGEAITLLSLDLSSLGDGSQLTGRAAITNSGQGSAIRTKTDITHTDKSSMCGLRLRHMQDSTVNSECGVPIVACLGASENVLT
jgi:hypothetical protein